MESRRVGVWGGGGGGRGEGDGGGGVAEVVAKEGWVNHVFVCFICLLICSIFVHVLILVCLGL